MKKGWIKIDKPKSRVKKGYDMPVEMGHMPPRLHLTAKDLPEVKDWKVGSTYTVSLEIKQTGVNASTYDGREDYCADFEVQAIKVL
jgi:hypothetical protein